MPSHQHGSNTYFLSDSDSYSDCIQEYTSLQQERAVSTPFGSAVIMEQLQQWYAEPRKQVPVELIARERRKGKTEKLIKMAAKRGARIVTNNTRMCHYILQKANKMGYTIPEPITYYQAEQTQPIEPLLLDDVEIYLLNKFVGVEAITMSVGKECQIFEERKLK